MSQTIRMGTRGSKLALWQAEYVRSLMQETHPGLDVEIQVFHTKGDKVLNVALSKMGDKGLFTKELERALLDGRVDICVHSMKDMPTQLPEGLAIEAMPRRADARDALIDFGGRTLNELPAGSRVATGSLRRAAQLAKLRSDIEICEIRGNVDTRIEKVRRGEFDAVILAAAGVERMGMGELITERFEPSGMVPAAGQGAIAIEAREDDAAMAQLLAPIADKATMEAVAAERFILGALEGGCQVPIGAFAHFEEDCHRAVLDTFVSSLDGSRVARTHAVGPAEELPALAHAAFDDLRSQGAVEILAAIR